MSDVVSIKRDGSGLDAQEVETVFRDDPKLAVEPAPSGGTTTLVATWRASRSSRPEAFVYAGGEIAVTTPTDAALVKMQQIAGILGASVEGEEGEDPTNVDAAPQSTRGGVIAGAVFLALVCGAVFFSCAARAAEPPPIRWALAQIHGLEVSSQAMGIRDRIRVVTLGTSGCTPRVAMLSTVNPESGVRNEKEVPLQGRAIEFEIEDFARTDALLRIECHRRTGSQGPPRTFTLALDASKGR